MSSTTWETRREGWSKTHAALEVLVAERGLDPQTIEIARARRSNDSKQRGEKTDERANADGSRDETIA